jgi:hypothetical protein
LFEKTTVIGRLLILQVYQRLTDGDKFAKLVIIEHTLFNLPNEASNEALKTINPVNDDAKSVITVLRSQTCPIVTQILNSRVGPLVQGLLTLPLPDQNQQMVADLIYTEFDYPLIHMQFSCSRDYNHAKINVRYNMRKGNVELQFSMFGGSFKLPLMNTLAIIATDAYEGVTFAKGKSIRDLYTWTFDIPDDPYKAKRLADNLLQCLKRILYCKTNERMDERFMSSKPNRHMDDQSIFEMALECYTFAGKSRRLIDILRIVPSEILEYYINGSDYALENGSLGSFALYLELLNPECINYLKNERGILTDENILEILITLLFKANDDVKAKVRELIEKQITIDGLRELMERVCTDISEDEQSTFIKITLPQLTLLFPELYPHFKQYAIAYYCDLNHITMLNPWNYEILSYHLNQWSSQECFLFFDILTIRASIHNDIEIGRIVPFLMYPGMIEELKKYVVKNKALNSYYKGLVEYQGRPHINLGREFVSQFPSEDERKSRVEQELSNFHKLAEK